MSAKLKLLVLASLIALFTTLLGSAQEVVAVDETLLGQPQALEFHIYDLDWVRYHNLGPGRQPKLSAAEDVVFPFQRYNNGSVRLRLSDLEKPGAIAALVAAHEIAYDEAAVVGSCDPNRIALSVFCIPGTRGMERGQIFLALFDPDSQDLAALTATIDNAVGGAVVPASQPAPAPTEPAEAPPPPAQPATEEEPEDIDNCCQLGWQCSTNRQWTNGYWAYKNDQCSAAEHTQQRQMQQNQPRQPTPPSRDASSQSSQPSRTRQSSQPRQSSGQPAAPVDNTPRVRLQYTCWMQVCGTVPGRTNYLGETVSRYCRVCR